MEVVDKARSIIQKLPLYWNHAPKGRYMPFKEIAALSLGGIGSKMIITVVQVMILYTGNTMIGNTIGISPQPMYIIYVLSVLASIPLTVLRARIIDNSRNKKGKYRPYILYMGIPTVILGIGFVYMPYDQMNMLWKCITVLLFNIGFQFFFMFYNDSYESLINVLSPNTYERSDVTSIKSITDSFAPTLMNLFLPIVARAIVGGTTIFDMRVYRAFYPPVLIVGFALSILIYTGTKERTIQVKDHSVHIKFMDALRAVAKNKYFWIISIASCIGFLETSFGNILTWMYNYQHVCSDGQFALITTIYGNSSLWAMVFAPFLIRKYGKRNLIISANALNIGFIAVMYPVVENASRNSMIWMFLICLFINGIANQLTITLTPSLNGDVRDYQHYITGERMDGIFAVVGIISSIFNLITGSVLPTIYDKAGINKETAISLGYSGKNVYDVLYDEQYFRRICGVLIIASVIGATLNLLPYLLYDLTEIKQRAMITVIKIRTLFEDYGNNDYSDADLIETIDTIEEAYQYIDREEIKINKDGIKAAKKTKDKELIKEAKLQYHKDKETNEKIIIAQYVVKEIEKYNTENGKRQIERAKSIASRGINELRTLDTIDISYIRSLPKTTKDDKEIRSAWIELSRQEKASRKLIKKYYPDIIEDFDHSVFDKLFKAEDDANAELKETDDKAKIRELKQRKREIAHEIKKATNQYSIYKRVAKPYVDAKKIILQKENYERYEEIKARYEESMQNVERDNIAAQKAREKEKAEKEAYAASLKAAKNNRKK